MERLWSSLEKKRTKENEREWKYIGKAAYGF
jgi:hypothetical protein